MKVQVDGNGRERVNGDALAIILEEGLGSLGRTNADCGVAIGCSIVTDAEGRRVGRHGGETDLVVAAWFNPALVRVVGSLPTNRRTVTFHSFCAVVEAKNTPAYELGSMKPRVVEPDGSDVFPADQAYQSGISIGNMMRARGAKVFALDCVWLRRETVASLQAHANPTLATFFGGDARLDDFLAAVANSKGGYATVIRAPGGKKAIERIMSIIAPVRERPPSPAPPSVSVLGTRVPTVLETSYVAPRRPQPPTITNRQPNSTVYAPRASTGRRATGLLVVALVVGGTIFAAMPRHAPHHKPVAIRRKPVRVAHAVQPVIVPRRHHHRVKAVPSSETVAAGLSNLAIQGAEEHGDARKAAALSRLAGVR